MACASGRSSCCALELAECDTRARESLLATMNHETRTPLTGIVGCMDLLAGSHSQRARPAL